MRTPTEIQDKIDEIEIRIIGEPDNEVATRAACERDALEWALGEDVALHDMSKIKWNKDHTYTVTPYKKGD